jgi:hypothetical protein
MIGTAREVLGSCAFGRRRVFGDFNAARQVQRHLQQSAPKVPCFGTPLPYATKQGAEVAEILRLCGSVAASAVD